MWDRQTETWRQQFSGDAVVGWMAGRTLAMLPSALVSCRAFRGAHPTGRMLSCETGIAQRAIRHGDGATDPFLPGGPVGPRLPAKDHSVGIVWQAERGGAARAYAVDGLCARGVVADTLGGEPLVVLWEPAAAPALGASSVAATSGRVRPPSSQPRFTSVRLDGGGFRDAGSGSTRGVHGRATAGPLAGEALEPVPHRAVFWFVWSAFQPDGGLYMP